MLMYKEGQSNHFLYNGVNVSRCKICQDKYAYSFTLSTYSPVLVFTLINSFSSTNSGT